MLVERVEVGWMNRGSAACLYLWYELECFVCLFLIPGIATTL